MIAKIQFDFEYPDKLQPVLTSDKRFIVLKGGRGGGKSHFLARKFLADRLHQKRDLLCVREIQESLEESSYKLLKLLIGEYNLPYKVMSNKIISLTTGSEIVFKGMNDITEASVKSYEAFDDAWIEEGQKLSGTSFQLLEPTIRKEGSKIYVSMNPDYEDDPVLDEIQQVHLKDALIIHINYDENPFCSQVILNSANNYKINKPDEYKHLYLGEPKSGSGDKVVKNWSKENVRDIPYLKELPVIIGMDFNRNPMSWVLCHKDETALYCFSEHVRENTWIRPCISELLDTYKGHEGGFIICGDSSGNQLRSEGEGSCYAEIWNEFTKRGFKQINADEIEAGEYYNGKEHISTKGGRYFAFNLSSSNPSRSSRFNSFNNLVIDELGQRNLFVNLKNCPWLMYNIKNLKHKPGSNEFDIPTVTQVKNDPSFVNELKYLGHPYDAISYIIYKYWPMTRLYDKIVM